MRLNWDVLIHIMASLDLRDAAKMSRTCRTIRRAAPPVLLKDTIFLSKLARFLSLRDFMLADSRRFCHLRRLYLGFYVDETGDFDQLLEHIADFLVQATNLECLHIVDATLMLTHAPILAAISSLSRLRLLWLENAEDDIDQVIRLVHPPSLRELILDPSYYETPFDPLPAVSVFSDCEHLTAITLHTADFSDSTPINCPHVSSLQLVFCRYPALEIMECSFPNLRHISFELAGAGDCDDYNIIEGGRTSSMEPEYVPRWTSLARARGSIPSLYSLAIRCPINHLDLSPLTLKRSVDCDRLRTLLADHSPTTLELQVEASIIDLAELPDMLASVKSNLRHLHLHLDLRGVLHKNPAAKLMSLLESLSEFSLENLKLTRPRWELYDRSQPIDEEVVASPFVGLDTRTLAERAAHVMPSLRHICMVTLSDMHFRDHIRVFEVRDVEKDVHEYRGIFELSSHAAALVISQSPFCEKQDTPYI